MAIEQISSQQQVLLSSENIDDLFDIHHEKTPSSTSIQRIMQLTLELLDLMQKSSKSMRTTEDLLFGSKNEEMRNISSNSQFKGGSKLTSGVLKCALKITEKLVRDSSPADWAATANAMSPLMLAAKNLLPSSLVQEMSHTNAAKEATASMLKSNIPESQTALKYFLPQFLNNSSSQTIPATDQSQGASASRIQRLFRSKAANQVATQVFDSLRGKDISHAGLSKQSDELAGKAASSLSSIIQASSGITEAFIDHALGDHSNAQDTHYQRKMDTSKNYMDGTKATRDDNSSSRQQLKRTLQSLIESIRDIQKQLAR
jgi:hypothetical protein